MRLERLVSMAGSSALQVHAYLRPLLAEIASRRLAARGQSLERMPEPPAGTLLGERLWEIVRPDRPFPEDRHGPRDLLARAERDARGARAAVSRSPSPRLPGLLALAGAGVVAGLASGRPELAVLAAPFLLLVGVGLVLAEEPRVVGQARARAPTAARGRNDPCDGRLHNEGAGAVELELALVRTAQLALEPDGHAAAAPGAR